MSSAAYRAKAHCASSITTTSSTPEGQPSARRRPVVTTNGRPTRFNATRCRAASAATLLTPGTTAYSKAISPRARMSSTTASVLS